MNKTTIVLTAIATSASLAMGLFSAVHKTKQAPKKMVTLPYKLLRRMFAAPKLTDDERAFNQGW